MKKYLLTVLALLLIFSCSDRQPSITGENANQDNLILSVLWFQKSAEMRALYYQGYNIAKSRLLEKIKPLPHGKPKAVIMDIDETILDNSPLEAQQVLKNIPFSDSLWKSWINKSAAGACPGALEFTRFADSLHIDVFYITNREMPEEMKPTLENLRRLGFPFADTMHIVLRTKESSKETRRRLVCGKYEVLLLIGDNLADFDSVFDTRGEDLGFGAVETAKEKFGSDFIVLPNPMYGPWVNAAIRQQNGETTNQKILNSLIGF
jgi:5'-nucleotidase (lipoprotein e(P4) family)